MAERSVRHLVVAEHHQWLTLITAELQTSPAQPIGNTDPARVAAGAVLRNIRRRWRRCASHGGAARLAKSARPRLSARTPSQEHVAGGGR